AAGPVEPLAPVRPGPAIARAAVEEAPDLASSNRRMDGAEGRAEDDVRRADEQPFRALRETEQLRCLLERGRHTLLDEDVLARLERCARQRPMLVHAREDEDDVDLVAPDHRLGAGAVRVD